MKQLKWRLHSCESHGRVHSPYGIGFFARLHSLRRLFRGDHKKLKDNGYMPRARRQFHLIIGQNGVIVVDEKIGRARWQAIVD